MAIEIRPGGRRPRWEPVERETSEPRPVQSLNAGPAHSGTHRNGAGTTDRSTPVATVRPEGLPSSTGGGTITIQECGWAALGDEGDGETDDTAQGTERVHRRRRRAGPPPGDRQPGVGIGVCRWDGDARHRYSGPRQRCFDRDVRPVHVDHEHVDHEHVDHELDHGPVQYDHDHDYDLDHDHDRAGHDDDDRYSPLFATDDHLFGDSGHGGRIGVGWWGWWIVRCPRQRHPRPRLHRADGRLAATDDATAVPRRRLSAGNGPVLHQ